MLGRCWCGFWGLRRFNRFHDYRKVLSNPFLSADPADPVFHSEQARRRQRRALSRYHHPIKRFLWREKETTLLDYKFLAVRGHVKRGFKLKFLFRGIILCPHPYCRGAEHVCRNKDRCPLALQLSKIDYS